MTNNRYEYTFIYLYIIHLTIFSRRWISSYAAADAAAPRNSVFPTGDRRSSAHSHTFVYTYASRRLLGELCPRRSTACRYGDDSVKFIESRGLRGLGETSALLGRLSCTSLAVVLNTRVALSATFHREYNI